MKKNNPNSQIESLIKEAENSSIKLSSLLLKTKTISKKLKLERLFHFVTSELEGKFSPGELPEYRIRFASPVGLYKNNFNGQIQEVPLNMDDLCKQFGFESGFFYRQNISQSVIEIENHIDKNKLSEIRITFTPSQLRLMQEYSSESGPWVLFNGYYKMSLSIFPAILLNIRSLLLEHLIEAEEQENSSVEAQKLFVKGTPFDAIVVFLEVIKSAKESIILIDNYINDKTLKLLTEIGKSISILIITHPKSLTASFNILLESFNKHYRTINIRTTLEFHDRFIIIDNKEYYNLGASIKDAGDKVFMFTQINDPKLHQAINDIIRTIK
jgi:hypothetical protein